MAKLTSKKRNALPSSDFAVAGRKYPINDKSHARNALARVAQHGTSEQKAAVRAKVHKKFPGIGQSKGGKLTKHEMEHKGHKAVSDCSGHCMM